MLDEALCWAAQHRVVVAAAVAVPQWVVVVVVVVGLVLVDLKWYRHHHIRPLSRFRCFRFHYHHTRMLAGFRPHRLLLHPQIRVGIRMIALEINKCGEHTKLNTRAQTGYVSYT